MTNLYDEATPGSKYGPKYGTRHRGPSQQRRESERFKTAVDALKQIARGEGSYRPAQEALEKLGIKI